MPHIPLHQIDPEFEAGFCVVWARTEDVHLVMELNAKGRNSHPFLHSAVSGLWHSPFDPGQGPHGFVQTPEEVVELVQRAEAGASPALLLSLAANERVRNVLHAVRAAKEAS